MTIVNANKSHIKMKGGKRLTGTVSPDGAKNSALLQLAALTLSEGKEIILNNIPFISYIYIQFNRNVKRVWYSSDSKRQ